MNKILGENRVIVSDIAGTTRDTIDSYFENEFGKFMFMDTAGNAGGQTSVTIIRGLSLNDIPKNDQKWSSASLFKANIINMILHHMKIIRWSSVAFLCLNKSIQKRKNIIDAMMMMNWSSVICIIYFKIISCMLKL